MWLSWIWFLFWEVFFLLITSSGSSTLHEALLTHRHDLQILPHRPHPQTKHRAVIAIKPLNEAALESILFDVSMPDSPRYGQHWTLSDVRTLTQNRAAYETVVKYFLAQGGNVLLPAGENERNIVSDYVEVEGTVVMWEKVLQTTFHYYESRSCSSSGKSMRLLRAKKYSLPSELLEHTEGILNIIDFPSAHHWKLSEEELSTVSFTAKDRLPAAGISERELSDSNSTEANVDNIILPVVLNHFYDIRSNQGSSKTSQAIFGRKEKDQSGNVSLADLRLFETFLGNGNRALVYDQLGNMIPEQDEVDITASPDPRSNVELQYMTALAQDIPTVFYHYENEANQTYFWLNWLREVSLMKDPPKVISIGHYDYERDVTRLVARLFNLEAMKLGIAGVTIIASSGIDGVAGEAIRESVTQCGYRPLFPATSPYVTVVGSTAGLIEGTAEVGASGHSISSGGGFSAYFRTPLWQNRHVKGFLDPACAPDPTMSPTNPPTNGPTELPSFKPSFLPTEFPTKHPTAEPTTQSPSFVPTCNPTRTPSQQPSFISTELPTVVPTNTPTEFPSVRPTVTPSLYPSTLFPSSRIPSNIPTIAPTVRVTERPTESPTIEPTLNPTGSPTAKQTSMTPSISPSVFPTPNPTIVSTSTPTVVETLKPSETVDIISMIPTPVPTFVKTDMPTEQPSEFPSTYPTISPSTTPTVSPTIDPTISPTETPSVLSTITPSLSPTLEPSLESTGIPTEQPSLSSTEIPSDLVPTFEPTSVANDQISLSPSLENRDQVSLEPSPAVTDSPSQEPSIESTLEVTMEPSVDVGVDTFSPTEQMTIESTAENTVEDTFEMTAESTLEETFSSSVDTTVVDTFDSTHEITEEPTLEPSVEVIDDGFPSLSPTEVPTEYISTVEQSLAPSPSETSPSVVPTCEPTNELQIISPSVNPTFSPTEEPTYLSTLNPSEVPSFIPSNIPSFDPTYQSSVIASLEPTVEEIILPVEQSSPTISPTSSPTINPTNTSSSSLNEIPSTIPSALPTENPTETPSIFPTVLPTVEPTLAPTEAPTISPSALPTVTPFQNPTEIPTISPTASPTKAPTAAPTTEPTTAPTALPTTSPTASPTASPTISPTSAPTASPTTAPSSTPTTVRPTAVPTFDRSGALTLESWQSCPSFSAGQTDSGTKKVVTCRVKVCGNYEVQVSQCRGDGGTCTDDPMLRVFDADSEAQLSWNDDYCWNCAGLTFQTSMDVDSCKLYDIRQGCFATANCTGTTVAKLLRPVQEVQLLPSQAPSSQQMLVHEITPVLNHFVLCHPFDANYTASATRNVDICKFQLCGKYKVVVSLCAGNGTKCTGDTYLRVKTNDGRLVTMNDDYCGDCSAVAFESFSECLWYEIHEGCFGDSSCHGQVKVLVTPTNVTIPSALWSGNVANDAVNLAVMNRWYHCHYYQASMTYSASAEDQIVRCQVQVCGNIDISVSQCKKDGGSCAGDSYLRVMDTSSMMQFGANDDALDNTCGLCSAMNISVTNNEEKCKLLEIHQGCSGTDTCGGITAVRTVFQVTATPSFAPTALDTFQQINAEVGKINYCRSFQMHDSNSAIDRYDICAFSVCGHEKEVEVSMCNNGNGTFCTGVPVLRIEDSDGNIANVTTTSSMYPTYRFNLKAFANEEEDIAQSIDECKTIYLYQGCANDTTCSGRTSIQVLLPPTPTPTMSPVANPTAAPTVILEPYYMPSMITDQVWQYCRYYEIAPSKGLNVPYISCFLEVCGNRRVKVSQCEGSQSFCAGDSSLAVYKHPKQQDQELVMVASGDDDCGYCAATSFVNYNEADVCDTFEVRQACYPGTECKGVTGVQLTTVASLAPTKAPTSKPTRHIDEYTIPGGITAAGQAYPCASFQLSGSESATEYYSSCIFEVCDAHEVVVSLCNQVYSAASCQGDTFLRVFDKSNGTEVVNNDDLCGRCSGLTFQSRSNQCTLYEIRQGCFGDEECGGTTVVYVVPPGGSPLTGAPAFQPTHQPTNEDIASSVTVAPTESPTSEYLVTASPTIAPSNEEIPIDANDATRKLGISSGLILSPTCKNISISGRGYPDVALFGDNYGYVWKNETALISSTQSAAVFAAMISLINSARVEAGLPTLGWINPALYRFQAAFVRDIVEGQNNCGFGAENCCSNVGFVATSGWDPVTGLGSVNFTAMKEVFMKVNVSTTRPPTLHPTVRPGDPTYEPTAAPSTATPSYRPSIAPSIQTQPIVQIESSISLSGIESVEEIGDVEKFTVRQAQALILDVSVDDVEYTGAELVVSTRALSPMEQEELVRSDQLKHQKDHNIELLASKVVCYTTIKLSLIDYPNLQGNTSQLYEAVKQKIVEAVSTGLFEETLKSVANVMNVTMFYNVTSREVILSAPIEIFPPSAVPTTSPSKAPTNLFTKPVDERSNNDLVLLVAVLIVVGVFLIGVGIMCYWCFQQREIHYRLKVVPIATSDAAET